ncbi:unnamed protein product [Cyclocybe aegerita]|uniref:HAT C-terminal dimerisation domain-containing protein n=1 Tax=Cyclocybe aegerita TaxID=1973307 RepID=A0A8S0XSI1_CYCAE|nr:unnamed protein product [Cyclocybe aegerita]
MCFPHVINICVTHVTESFTDLALASDEAEFAAALPPADPHQQTFDKACAWDPIALCRGAVCAICASGKRRKMFQDIIRNSNEKEWFKAANDPNKIIKLENLELLHDVRHQWDSLYKMIRRFREMRQACNYFLLLPPNRELTKFCMTDLQTLMCSERTPILVNAIPAFEMFMTAWERLGEKFPHLEPYAKVGIEWVVKYYNKMDLTKAYMIAMVLNPSIRLSWIRKNWDEEFIDEANQTIKDLMVEYCAHANPEMPARRSPVTMRQGFGLDELAERYGLDDLMDFTDNNARHNQSIDKEFTAYFTALLSEKGTDILKFWEIHESSFLTLFAIVLDYLPIQASAVPFDEGFQVLEDGGLAQVAVVEDADADVKVIGVGKGDVEEEEEEVQAQEATAAIKFIFKKKVDATNTSLDDVQQATSISPSSTPASQPEATPTAPPTNNKSPEVIELDESKEEEESSEAELSKSIVCTDALELKPVNE